MPIEPDLVKLHIDLPNHWATGGEALWAKSLGDDLYEIDNIPFHAYGLNCGDVVRATADSPTLKPEIRAVVRRSGHQTLRIVFQELPSSDRLAFLTTLNATFGTSFEGRDNRFFALDIPPQADYGRVREHLDGSEAQGLLNYETCEARRPGSFDDLPQDNRHSP